MAIDKYTNLENIRDVLNKSDTKHVSLQVRWEKTKVRKVKVPLQKYINILI